MADNKVIEIFTVVVVEAEVTHITTPTPMVAHIYPVVVAIITTITHMVVQQLACINMHRSNTATIPAMYPWIRVAIQWRYGQGIHIILITVVEAVEVNQLM